GIRVFPKTKLSVISKEDGMIDPKEDFLKPIFYISPAIKKEILPFVNEFSKKHPTWIFPGLNININVELQKKLRRFGIKGPLWEHMKIGKKFTPRFS
ncbi:MAG: B12-binding domain-containing radical SAM protein, partial [Proteobacteria bacterium]|nr:B12-binding domain-containing radical SAM protein [Pseudomonadota bacterium]